MYQHGCRKLIKTQWTTQTLSTKDPLIKMGLEANLSYKTSIKAKKKKEKAFK